MLMRERVLCRLGIVLTLLLASLGGCVKPKPADPKPPAVVSYVQGTVREFAVYDTAGFVPLQGYGVVTNLGKNGSREVPENLKDYLVQYLAKKGIGIPPSQVTPMMMLQDLDTGIVLVRGTLPFGAPVGTRFDISVSALPSTQTRSIQGGNLLTSDLILYFGSPAPGNTTRPLAEGGGDVFANPFVDPNDERDLVKWREGKVLGGGRVVYENPIKLQLRQPDFARAGTMARRINETFRGASGASDVANAINRATIELRVPNAWRDDYEHFLELVMHVPLSPATTWETRARELLRMMQAPDTGLEEISLILEAMGRNTVPLLRPLFTSRNSAAAFYAARTAGRLGDAGAEQVLIRFAGEAGSPFRIAAIEELGRNDRLGGAVAALQPLVDDENSLVRIAAYEALVRRHDNTVITSVNVDGQLTLDLVKSRRSYVIYGTQTMEPRLALFGADMPVARPIFFNPPDELITIRSVEADPNRSVARRVRQWVEDGMPPCGDAFVALLGASVDPANRVAPEGGHCLAVFRKMPNGKYTDVVMCTATVRALVKEMAAMSDRSIYGDVHGLRLSYGQVLNVVYRMCQKGDIPAKFSLQSETAGSRIRGTGPAVGRPDVPE
jgi:hypothetical protein